MKKLLSLIMLLVAIATGAKAADWPVAFGEGTKDFTSDATSNYSGTSTNTTITSKDGKFMLVTKGSSMSFDASGGMKLGNSSNAGALMFYIAAESNITVTVRRNGTNTDIKLDYMGATNPGNLTGSNMTTAGTNCDTKSVTSNSTDYTLTKTSAAAGYYKIYAANRFMIKSIVVASAGPAKAYKVTAASNNTDYGTASADASSLDEGEETTITATPKAGYEFTSWTVEGTGAQLSSETTNPTTLTIGTSDATVTATFTVVNNTITHNAATNGTYTISVAGGEATSANTTATIGQTITLVGTPAAASFTEVAWNVKDADNKDVTVTNNQFTMPGSAVSITPVFSKPYFVKVAVKNKNSADITGTAKDDATAGVNCQDNTKLGSDGHYVGFSLATETFQTGDIVEVKISQGGGGKIKFYEEKEGTTLIFDTDVTPDAGTYRFVLPAEAVGKNSIYLVRTANSGFNPYVTYIAIIRPDATITLNSNGYGTYSKATDFEFAGAKAYKMNLNYTGGTMQGTEVTGKIKAGEGILFKGEAGATVAITETTGASALADNSLVGTTPATGDAPTPDYTSYKYFVLKGKSFVPYTTATTFGAGKAFFQVAKDAQLPASLELVFDGEEATAVEAVAEAKANAVAPVKIIKNGKLFIGNYNVAGQQVK